MTLSKRLGLALAEGMARDAPIIPHDSPVMEPSGPVVDAAVLVAITDRSEPGVILTQRPDTMRKHPGQVAFPGGRMDPDDADLVAAALREAQEEIGLPPESVNVIGLADAYHTITGYVVTPVLAVIPPDLPLVANADEVEAIFEVPLAFLLDPANHQMQTVVWEGETRHFYEMHWNDRRIWGATAAMIVNLSWRIRWPF